MRFDALHIIHATHFLMVTLLPLTPRETPVIVQNYAMPGEDSRVKQ